MNHNKFVVRRKLSTAAVSATLAILSGAVWAQEQNANGNTAQQAENRRQSPVPLDVVAGKQVDHPTPQHADQYVSVSRPKVDIPGKSEAKAVTAGQPKPPPMPLFVFLLPSPGTTLGTYIDDMPMNTNRPYAEYTYFLMDQLSYDFDWPRVLRGPQGALFGAGTSAMLVQYVTKDPDPSGFSGQVGGGLSMISGASGGPGWDSRAHVNVPIIKDKLAVSVSASQNKTPGYINNVRTGQRGVNDVTQRAGRIALLWRPNSEVGLKLSALHQSYHSSDAGFVLLDPTTEQPLYGQQKNSFQLEQPTGKHINQYMGQLNWDLHWVDLISTTSYSSLGTNFRIDASTSHRPAFVLFGFPADTIGRININIGLKKFTQEVRLTSKPGGTLDWQLGAFYTHETSGEAVSINALTADFVPIAALNPTYLTHIASTYKEGALFGNLTYKLSDRFDVTGGLRLARDEQNYNELLIGARLPPIPPGNTLGRLDENVLTGSLSPRYHPDENNMLYVRASKSYRPGGPNLPFPLLPPDVKPDTQFNYEAGWQSLFLDNRASLDVAVYESKWHELT